MLCDHCGIREATVHIQKIVNGTVEMKHYCNECTEKLSGTGDFDGMNLMEILSNLSGKIKEQMGADFPVDLPGIKNSDKNENIPQLVCPACNWDWAHVLKTERCMCPQCYETFAEPMMELLKRHHKGLIHTGSSAPEVPSDPETAQKQSLYKRMDELQREMDFMVEKEEYEVAAHLRDELNRLRNELAEQEDTSDDAR